MKKCWGSNDSESGWVWAVEGTEWGGQSRPEERGREGGRATTDIK